VSSRANGHQRKRVADDQQPKIGTTNAVKTLIPGSTYDDLKNHIKEIINNKWLSIWKFQTTKLNTVLKNYKQVDKQLY